MILRANMAANKPAALHVKSSVQQNVLKALLTAQAPFPASGISYTSTQTYSLQFSFSGIPLTNKETDTVQVFIDGIDSKAHIVEKSATFGTFEEEVKAEPGDFGTLVAESIRILETILNSGGKTNDTEVK